MIKSYPTLWQQQQQLEWPKIKTFTSIDNDRLSKDNEWTHQ